jgi:SpoVK/Ycf46/Vps4 family AAA+-type ATPase
VRTLQARPGPLSPAELIALCRAEAGSRMGALAQPVAPRFTLDELVLPPRQAGQLETIADSMRALTRVHYEWGTARAWNESGLAVLFCGSSGTGKTMAAEALAQALDLPLYRIDLSQVVNKYIGETEKNLARIFDAAEESDSILFFDEADALFGKRTDVKDAHDRFANIEISYLLERMERFKGLAILATNRRKDLDEAFTRRLRYVVEFPLPGAAERERIWHQVFPKGVDAADLDFGFLAGQFELSGGHIRSAAFNACLHRAAKGGDPRLAMADVLIAIGRELDKLDRVTSPEQFGRYAHLVRDT